MIIEDRAVLVEFAIDTLIYSLLKNTNDWWRLSSVGILIAIVYNWHTDR